MAPKFPAADPIQDAINNRHVLELVRRAHGRGEQPMAGGYSALRFAASEMEAIREWARPPSACSWCGNPIQPDNFLTSADGQRFYCSRECFKAGPAQDFNDKLPPLVTMPCGHTVKPEPTRPDWCSTCERLEENPTPRHRAKLVHMIHPDHPGRTLCLRNARLVKLANIREPGSVDCPNCRKAISGGAFCNSPAAHAAKGE